MSTIISGRARVGSGDHDGIIATRVLTMRRRLGVTVAELANATGMPDARISDIEAGSGTTPAERHDLAVALGWLANNHAARGWRRVDNG